MRHRVHGRRLSRTSSHRRALRRNMAQSLFQYGQVETTLAKAKEVRPFVERLITLARKDTLRSRQRLISILGDRSVIAQDEQERYDSMTDAQRHKVLRARSGRRHRAGKVPASYNKKKIPFVAQSIVHKLMSDVAPKYRDRPGGYTRIIRLSKRRIGDCSDLALLQLVGDEGPSREPAKKTVGLRRQKTLDRIQFLEGKTGRRPGRGRGGKRAGPSAKGPSSSGTKASATGEGSAVEDAAAPTPAESTPSPKDAPEK